MVSNPLRRGFAADGRACRFSWRAGDCSFSNAFLVLTKLTQRSSTAANSIDIRSGCSDHRGRPSAPCFDLTNTLSRLCAKLEVGTRMNSSDESVDRMIYWAHDITTHGFFVRAKPTAQQLADLEVPALACPSQDAWLPSYVERCGSSLISALVARSFSRVSLR
jgi:hypothetical protein